MQLFNDTPFVAQSFMQAGMDGLLNAVVVARGSFVLDVERSQRLHLTRDPSDDNWHDVFETTSRGTSLVSPGDLAPFKPGTDFTFVGAARSAEPRSSWPVILQIGRYRKILRVHGERYWEPIWRGIGRKVFAGWQINVGEPTTSVPLTWERAFGGPRPTEKARHALHEANPVGLGLLNYDLSPRDRLIPAPQIEAQADPIADWSKEYTPAGLAPIAPWWSERQRHSGSYNDTWRKTRRPLAPVDFKYDFWQAAPADQWFRPWLFGNEQIRLSGIFPTSSDIQFDLPLQKIFCLTKYRDNVFTANIMFLDGVHIVAHCSSIRLRLSWRASFPLIANVASATIVLLKDDDPRSAAAGGVLRRSAVVA